MNKWFLRALVLANVALFVGCGGSDDSNDSNTDTANDSGGSNEEESVVGLTLPENMSIVTAQDDSNIANSLIALAFDDPGTEYSGDTTNTYVYDRSMESLSIVNMILCLMEQTAATDMVNEGAYIALVNEDKCEQGQNQSSAGQTGQASGSQATEYNSWTINSTRDDNDSPQTVQIWVPGEESSEGDPMDAQTIIIDLTVNEGADENNPFGSFVMNFKGVIDGGLLGGTAGEEVETMHGVLETVDNDNGLQFRFYNAGGDSNDSTLGSGFGFEEAVNVVMDDASGISGSAITYNRNEFTPPGESPEVEEGRFAISFDSANLHRGLDNTGDNTIDEQACLSREDFNTQVWRYNLYHRDDGTFNGEDVVEGERVALNSGFPFTYDSDDDSTNDAYGFAGYHGVWTESGDIEDGQTITQFDYANDSTTEHTVNVSSGRLIRRTAETELLSSFQGDEFMYWGMHPNLEIFGEWIVTVDSNNAFQLIESFQWGENGMERSSTIDHDGDPATAEVDVTATLPLNNRENIWLWSDALGGNVSYVHDDSVAATNRRVTFYGEEFVFPGDTTLFANGNSLTLYCYERCLKGGISQDDVDNATSEMDLFYTYSGTPFQYTISSQNGKLVLTDDSNSQEVSAVALDMENIGHDWGINSGEMITSQLSNAAEPWMVYDQETTYRWETGSNDWNKLVTVRDANDNVQTFDAPLRFVYTHTTGNDANGDSTYNNKKFQLEYGGPGELWGFPWVEDSENNRWYAAATLKNGTELSDGTNSFVVKQIEREQTMQVDNSAECSSLDISGLFSDSSLALPSNADLNTISIGLSDKPTVSDAPAVIAGELQD